MASRTAMAAGSPSSPSIDASASPPTSMSALPMAASESGTIGRTGAADAAAPRPLP